MNWVGVGRVGVVGEIDFWSGQEWWSSYSDPFDFLNQLGMYTQSLTRHITPAFEAGLERSGKPVRQHAIVIGSTRIFQCGSQRHY